MASLLDNLRNSNPELKTSTGQLGSTSREELQKASSSLGMPASPTSPLGASSIGVSADSAKMAGASAQKFNALRESVKGEDQLGTYLRREQGRQKATAEEQQKMQRTAGLSMFWRLDQIADKMTEKALTGDKEVFKQFALLPETDIRQVLPPGADYGKAKPLLEKYANNTITAAELLELAKITGVATGATTIESIIENPAQINETLKKSFFRTDDDKQIVEGIAGSIDQKGSLSVSALTSADLEELGFSSVEQMASALNIDPASLRKMSIDELNTNFQNQFQDVDVLRAMSVDPNLSSNERQQALDQLKALGAVGMRYAMESMDPIQKQVDAATRVNIPGAGEISIAQIADDKVLSGLIANAIASGKLEELPAGLQAWVKKNREAAGKLGAGLTAKMLEAGKAASANYKTVEKVPGDDMKKVIFGEGFNPLSTTPLQPAKIFTDYETLPADSTTRAAIETFLQDNDFAKLQPEMAKQIAQMDAAALASAGMNTPDGMRRALSYYEIFSVAQDSAASTILTDYFGVSNTDEAQSLLNDIDNMQKSGSFTFLPDDLKLVKNSLDANNDGKLDSPEMIKAAFQQNFLGGTEKLAPVQVSTLTLPSDIKTIIQGAKTKVSNDPRYTKYSSWVKDGKLDSTDITMEIAQMAPGEALDYIQGIPLPSNIKKAVDGVIQGRYKESVKNEIDALGEFNLQEKLDYLKKRKPANSLEKPAIDAMIKELEADIKRAESTAALAVPVAPKPYDFTTNRGFK